MASRMRLVLLLRIWTSRRPNQHNGSTRRDGSFVEVPELGMVMFSPFKRKFVMYADRAPPPALTGGGIDLRKCR